MLESHSWLLRTEFALRASNYSDRLNAGRFVGIQSFVEYANSLREIYTENILILVAVTIQYMPLLHSPFSIYSVVISTIHPSSCQAYSSTKASYGQTSDHLGSRLGRIAKKEKKRKEKTVNDGYRHPGIFKPSSLYSTESVITKQHTITSGRGS